MRHPHDWEEALNDVIDEKKEVLDALDNIVSLWEVEASMSKIENAMVAARRIIDKHTTQENEHEIR
jgi:hypothetical protein